MIRLKSVTKKNKYEIDMCNGSLMDKLISFFPSAYVIGNTSAPI